MLKVPVATIDQLTEGATIGVEHNDQGFLLVERQGEIFAYVNSCPHRGIRLEWQPDQFLDVEKQYIQCSTHGALFVIDSGQCIAGPCNGAYLTKVETIIEEQQIYLCIEDSSPVDQEARN